jgi:hypothetical protein
MEGQQIEYMLHEFVVKKCLKFVTPDQATKRLIHGVNISNMHQKFTMILCSRR